LGRNYHRRRPESRKATINKTIAQHLNKTFDQGHWFDAESITLINNAAVLGEVGYLGEQQNEHYNFVLIMNVIVPAMFMNTFLNAYFATQIRRVILNIGSGAAQRPVDDGALTVP
jgi:benzil reductase ((S)-benzoin forming)